MAVVAVAASAARTTSGSSAAITSPSSQSSAIHVDVTAVTGTSPNLALTVEWSNDGITWVKSDPVDSFTAITAASTAVKTIVLKGAYFRLVWTLTGTTPSFTFSSSLWVA